MEATLEGHADMVSALVALGDDRLASGSWDHSIRLWWSQNNTWSSVVAFAAEGPICALAYAANEQMLIAGDSAGRVHFLRLID